MAYPATKVTITDPTGTLTLNANDHAANTKIRNDTIEAIEDVLGTTAGTSVLKSFAAGEFPVRVNVGGTIVQTLVGGTIDNTVMGTPTITGGQMDNAVFGTPAVTGGTIDAATLGTPTIVGGTIDAATLGTPVMDTWNTSGTSTPSTAGAGVAPTVVTLSDAVGTITPNAAAGQVFSLAMGTAAGNRTLAVPDNPTEGQAIVYRIQQNAGDTGTLVLGTGYKVNDGGTPELGTAATWNYIGFRYYAGGTVWQHQGNSLGII